MRRLAGPAWCALTLLLPLGGRPAGEWHRLEPGALPTQTPVVDQVVHDLCAKRVALLGESPTHGFGRTLAFKVEIVRRLVDECHYNAFFVESGAYDFLNIRDRLASGQAISEHMIAAAIGGLWATQEVQPLVPFLLARAQRGALVLGGLDDQLGRGTWAQREMPAELAAYLDGARRAECLAVLQRHMLWQYTSDAPYGPKDNARIVNCVENIQARLSRSRHGPSREYHAAMLENLKRTLARDFTSTTSAADLDARGFNERDRSMYANFQWLVAHAPRPSKMIVWTAINHAAKDLSGIPGDATLVPLGSYIRRDFANDAFALGISALAGTYARTRQPARPLPPAPAASLEARVFDGNDVDVRYLNAGRLAEIGAATARLPGPDFRTARWNTVIDGLVILREERPPRFLDW
ncbi:MAG TPA: erythromycin esterase family protein [Gemmatimonadaceae bacterium]|nr:erythromycin esterase family protein [Gemmatimonadaceae bacterium]